MESTRAQNGSPTEIARAQRYAIDTLLRYRVRGEREWREGVMENISISGVLLRTTQPLEADTILEMRFLLPVELEGECAAEVICRGSVIRSEEDTDPDGNIKVAARIIHSRFLRQLGRLETREKSAGV